MLMVPTDDAAMANRNMAMANVQGRNERFITNLINFYNYKDDEEEVAESENEYDEGAVISFELKSLALFIIGVDFYCTMWLFSSSPTSIRSIAQFKVRRGIQRKGNLGGKRCDYA